MTGTLDSVWIFQACDQLGVAFEPIITDAIADKMSEHAELIASGISDYSFRILLACCVDELDAAQWIECMRPVVEAFEAAIRVREVLAQRSEAK